MPALPPYTPAKEANYNLWLLNFSSLIAANPPAYGLTATDATTIAAEAAWSAAKNTARVTTTALIRTNSAS